MPRAGAARPAASVSLQPRFHDLGMIPTSGAVTGEPELADPVVVQPGCEESVSLAGWYVLSRAVSSRKWTIKT